MSQGLVTVAFVIELIAAWLVVNCAPALATGMMLPLVTPSVTSLGTPVTPVQGTLAAVRAMGTRVISARGRMTLARVSTETWRYYFVAKLNCAGAMEPKVTVPLPTG